MSGLGNAITTGGGRGGAKSHPPTNYDTSPTKIKITFLRSCSHFPPSLGVLVGLWQRVVLQSSALMTWLGHALEDSLAGSGDTPDGPPALTRDEFNLHKLLIVATAPGKVGCRLYHISLSLLEQQLSLSLASCSRSAGAFHE